MIQTQGRRHDSSPGNVIQTQGRRHDSSPGNVIQTQGRRHDSSPGNVITTRFWAYDDLRWPPIFCDSVGHDSNNRRDLQPVVTFWRCLKISERLRIIPGKHNHEKLIVRRWIASVPISVIWHDPLRLPIVSYRIRCYPPHDTNNVVWSLSNALENKSAKWHCGRHTLICKKILIK